MANQTQLSILVGSEATRLDMEQVASHEVQLAVKLFYFFVDKENKIKPNHELLYLIFKTLFGLRVTVRLNLAMMVTLSRLSRTSF